MDKSPTPLDLVCWNMASLVVTHPAGSVVQHLKISLTLFRHATCWKLIVGSCLATPTPNRPQLRDRNRYPTHFISSPDSFASTCIMLGINWIDDIGIQSILHQVSSRSQGLYTQTHPTVTTSQLLHSGTLPEWEATKKEHDHFDIPFLYQ